MKRGALRTSIIIPSRGEKFLVPTVKDVLAKARGDVEVLVVLDGYWPNPPLPDDKRVRVLHKGQAEGMRPAINDAAAVATGNLLMKLDAHCMLAEGFDVALAADCDRDWVVVPRRYSLDPERWAFKENGKKPVDYHFLSYPYEPGRPGVGLHGQVWVERARERAGKPEYDVDDEMSSQGSCWFMHKKYWERQFNPMDVVGYGNFVQEMQEIGMKAWLGGGALKVSKRTWYAHLHKGKEYGRGYFISKQEMSRGANYAVDYWMFDRWPGRVRDIKWLVEHFWPVPGWPADWEQKRFEEKYAG